MGVLLLSVPFWVRLSGRIGKKESFLLGLGILVVASLLLLVYPRGAGIGLYFIMVVAGVGTGAYFLLPYAILPEIVDEDELSSGTRREGAYFGIYFFLYKLAVALAPLIIGTVLGVFGYVSDSALSERTLLGIRSLVGGVPLILFLAAGGMLIRFPLSKARSLQIATELKRRGPRDGSAPTP
jgi:Na+/melibiose symporter-like transporter